MSLVPTSNIATKVFICGKAMFMENCYVVWCQNTLEAIIIDPGCFSAAETSEILAFIAEKKLKLKWIVNTHGHLDHIAGNGAIQSATGADILVHSADAPLLPNVNLNGSVFLGVMVTSPAASRTLSENETLDVGTLRFRVAHTPGHTRGGISLVGEGVAFTGDTLFAGGIGRTDLPGASLELELASIREKLLVLPNETEVFPGHGPKSTIGTERTTNPFL